LIKEHSGTKKKGQRIDYDNRTDITNYVVGEEVYFKNRQKKKKFDPDYVGPYKIIRADGNNNFTLNTPKKFALMRYNCSGNTNVILHLFQTSK